MKQHKYTPRPWTSCQITSGFGPGLLREVHGAMRPEYQRVTICRMHDFRPYGGEEADKEQAANAQLIAAAPELLEACRDCQEVMNATARLFVDDDHPGRAELHARADQLDVYAMRARAAIDKATGTPT